MNVQSIMRSFTFNRWLASFILLPALASAAASAACSRSSEAAPQAQAAPPPPEVGVYVVQPEAITLTAELPGRTAPFGIAEVRPQVNGLIEKRLFTEGADVRAGAPLYQIDAAPYEAALDSAKAALARSEANLTAARLRADRYRGLVAINAVSKQEFDDAEAARQQAEASIAGDKAAIRKAQIDLGYTRVVAPISGRVGRSAVTAGALVTASQAQALATVQQLDPIYVDVAQSSADLLRLRRELAAGRLKSDRPGEARVRLRLEDGSEYPQPGRLQFSEVSVDESTGAVTLRAVFPNPRRELLPGMYVRAVMGEGVSENGLLVPQQGVTRNPKGEATALVLGADNKVQMRTIEAPRAIGDRWLVTAGLSAGDRVIVEGVQKVRPGSVARVAATAVASTSAPAAAASQQ
jgi:membrane fusion protein (multidrug efflux system)